MKNLIQLFGISVLVLQLNGQPDAGVKVRIEATVVDYIEMITLADIDVGTVIPSDDILRLDPRNDQGAGLMLVQGRSEATIQISYSKQVEMINVQSATTLTVDYEVSGNGNNEQSSSVLFTSNPETVILNRDGEYYLWIGCAFSLSQLVPGQYDGDFVIEVDYN